MFFCNFLWALKILTRYIKHIPKNLEIMRNRAVYEKVEYFE